MVNPLKQSYKDRSWILINDIDQLLNQNKKNVSYMFSNSRYILDEIKPSTHYIAEIKIPIIAKVKDRCYNTHFSTTNRITINKVLDLKYLETWKELWNDDVDFMSNWEMILMVMVANDWYVPMTWFIKTLRRIKKEQYNKKKVLDIILKEAIASNSVDIVEYFLKETNDDLAKYNGDYDILRSLSKLAANMTAKADYCLQMIKLLETNNLFADASNHTVIMGFNCKLFQLMGHKQTFELLEQHAY